MILSGVLYNAGGPVSNARIIFTANKTSLNGVLKGAYKEFETQEDGTYFLNLEPGYYYVAWYPSQGPLVRLGAVTADDVTMATLPAALSAEGQPVNPDIVTDEVQEALNQIQVLRDEAEGFATDAAASAASLNATDIVHAPLSGLANEAGTAYSRDVGTGTTQLPTNADLGALAQINTLSAAPVGDVATLQTTLGVVNVADRGVAGGDASSNLASQPYVDTGLADKVDVGQVGFANVTTSTGTQTAAGALDDRVNKGEVGAESVTTDAGGATTVADALNARLAIVGSLAFSIPTDFPDMQAAFDSLWYLSPRIGQTITINIETGHALTKGLLLRGGDYSRWEITSTDATVFLAPGFIPAAGVQSIDYYEDAVLLADNCRVPKWSLVVDMQDQYGAGYSLFNLSAGFISTGCGVINAGKLGLAVSNSSKAQGGGCVFTGACWGSRITTRSELCAPLSDFSGAKNTNTPTITVAALDISRGSYVYITGNSTKRTNLSGSGAKGLACRRSKVVADFIDASGAASTCIDIQLNSQAHLSFSLANNGGAGLVVDIASQCAAENINCDNSAGKGVSVGEACSAMLVGATAINAGGVALEGIGASNICADGFVGTGAGADGLSGTNGATIQCRDGDFSGALNRGAIASEGSKLAIRGTNTRKGAVDDPTDTVVSRGSIIQFHLGTGGINQSINTITGSGIIFA